MTEDQARHTHIMAEADKVINIETTKQGLEDNKGNRNRLKEEEDDTESNPYQMAILNKVSEGWHQDRTNGLLVHT